MVTFATTQSPSCRNFVTSSESTWTVSGVCSSFDTRATAAAAPLLQSHRLVDVEVQGAFYSLDDVAVVTPLSCFYEAPGWCLLVHQLIDSKAPRRL